MSEWQDISTARDTLRDSQSRLVWVPGTKCIYCVNWDAETEQWNIFGGGYRAIVNGGNPSHWMLLPDPPEAK